MVERNPGQRHGPSTITSSAQKLVLAKTAVGKRSALITSAGRQSMMRISPLAVRSRISEWSSVKARSFYITVPGTLTHVLYMRETTNGIYDALLRGRFAFDFVHEDRLDPEHLSKYRALLLPNIAMLSDRQCQQIRDYVQSGGSIMASFETGLYDENLKPRTDFGLADLLGISKAGDVIGTIGNAYYGRIERQHPILEGFSNTNWLAGAQNRIPLKPVQSPILTVVPGFVRYPPELAYPPASHTDEPAVVLREVGSARVAYFPGDIERSLLAYRPRRFASTATQHHSLAHSRRAHRSGGWGRFH